LSYYTKKQGKEVMSDIPAPGCRSHRAFTTIELIAAVTASLILLLGLGVLLADGHRAWQRTYDRANTTARHEAMDTMLAMGGIGRKANRLDYHLYTIEGQALTPALPETAEPEETVFADAVEFRYWDVALDADDTYDLMDTQKSATAYALFYLDDDTLKVDYGPYPPGAAPPGGGARNTAGVTTRILARNVSTSADSDKGPFSHNTLNGVGQGSVRIDVNLTNPQDQQVVRLVAATLLRNMWPR